MLRTLKAVAIAIVTSASVSCVTGPSISKEDKIAGKTFTPPQGKALVYIYRNSSLATITGVTKCWLDRNFVGNLGSGTYMAIPVSPGQHTVDSFRDPNNSEPRLAPTVRFVATAGKSCFVRQTLNTRPAGVIMAGPTPALVPSIHFELSNVSETTGRAEVSKGRQVGFKGNF